jgi:hypothetical protein
MAKKYNRGKLVLPEGYDPYDINLKRMIDPKADEKNFIRGASLRCGAKKPSGKLCASYAGQGTDHVGHGRCLRHGGCSTGPVTAEGKAASAQNSRVHGFYSKALRPEEAIYFNEFVAQDDTGLKFEIMALKAKILHYLTKWSSKWDFFYVQRMQATADWVKCRACGKEWSINNVDSSKTCPSCRTYCDFEILKRMPLACTTVEAEDYADRMTRVTASETEAGGVRTFYHAGDLDDRALDRALNTLKRLVETHNRLQEESGDDLVGKINEELRAASRGRVSLSWDSGAQQRKDGGTNDVNRSQGATGS